MQFTIKLEESGEGGYTAQCLEIPAAISEGKLRKKPLITSRKLFSLFWK